MSNPSKAIHYKLANTAAVTAVVSTRIYQMRVMQGAEYPAIMIQKISDVPFSGKDGNEYFRARVQVNSYAENYNDANSLAKLVMDALDRATGSINGITVSQIDILNEIENMENFADFEGIFRVMQDYSIVYFRE